MNHKTTLENANKAIIQGDHETFLDYLTDDIRWNFVGDQILFGKEQIGRYLEQTYRKPPKFDVENIISEGDYLTAVGKISIADAEDEWVEYRYCDIWRFENGKMAELTAFVIKE